VLRLHLESLGLAAGTIKQRLAAVRRLAYEAAHSGLLSSELAAGMPAWVKDAMDRWLTAESVTAGRVFRAVSRHGTVWGNGLSENVIRYVVRVCALRLELGHLAPHDLRRTCAKLCHVNGGELEQIQFLPGHASVLTTERYPRMQAELGRGRKRSLGCLFSGDFYPR
jgi:hypothetical protein